MRKLFITCGLLAVSLFTSCSRSELRAVERHGPPVLVMHAGKAQLWLLIEQEEMKSRNVGTGRRLGNYVTDVDYHFYLQTHDPETTERMAKSHLLTIKDDAGGNTTQGHILGQDGEVVWLFLNDQPLALSSKDGSRMADATTLEAINPALQGQLSKEKKFYLFDAGLIVVTADGQRFRVRASDFMTEPYTPASDAHFLMMNMMATQWNGGYQTRDFLALTGKFDGQWLGLLSEKDAADTRDNESEDDFKCSYPEGKGARRTFWRASTGSPKNFTEGDDAYRADVSKVPGAATYLEAGMLIKEGAKEPLVMGNPRNLFVVHLTRLDSEGQLAITSVDPALRDRWTAKLPIQEMYNRFTIGDKILIYGMTQKTVQGVTPTHEFITRLDLTTGTIQSWNVSLERREP